MAPPLKHLSVRARVNRSSTRAILYALDPADIQIHELPTRFDADGNQRPWHVLTVGWWEAIWSSPMAAEYDSQSRQQIRRGGTEPGTAVGPQWDRSGTAAEFPAVSRDHHSQPADLHVFRTTVTA